jgi:glycosyltransferase involved in cell wall biosynthesis
MTNNTDIKKICLFNTCKIWGGGEKWHHDTALKFQDKGYDVIVCTNTNSELYARLLPTTIPVFQVSISNLSFLNPLKIFEIYRLFKKHRIDIVILGLPSDVKSAGIAAKLAGIQKIIYRRGTALPVKNSFLNKFIFKYIVTEVITNSVEIKKKFLEYNPNLFPNHDIHVIYNGIEINGNGKSLLPKLNGHSKQIILGNAGRLVEQKGQKYLIDIAKLLKQRYIDFKIRIAGKGQLKESLLSYARKQNVDDKIEFLDFVYDMNSFFKNIDIFLLPSLHEGSANIVLEAMYHSKPIIAFNVSSMPEIIENGITGYLVNFPDIEDFADKIIRLTNDYPFRKEMGDNAHLKVQHQFDFNKNILQLEELL